MIAVFQFNWSLGPQNRQQFSLNRQKCSLLKPDFHSYILHAAGKIFVNKNIKLNQNELQIFTPGE